MRGKIQNIMISNYRICRNTKIITYGNISYLPSLIKREDVLPLVVVDEVKLLQRRYDVVLFYRALLANLVDCDRGWVAVRIVGVRRLSKKEKDELMGSKKE